MLLQVCSLFWGAKVQLGFPKGSDFVCNMEEGGGSLRIGSSSIWRNSDAEIFSNSFEQPNDEEALKWAAIQKLPTVARLRKALLTSPDGKANEIDVQKLGLQEKRALLERLVRTAEEDNEKFLLKLKDRIDR